jgi:LysM repeat protein
LRALNPAFAQGRIVAAARRDVLMPLSALERHEALRVAANDDAPPLAEPAGEPARPREYVIRAGDTLGAIARRLGVSLKNLLRWNDLDVRAIVRPGQSLRLEH